MIAPEQPAPAPDPVLTTDQLTAIVAEEDFAVDERTPIAHLLRLAAYVPELLVSHLELHRIVEARTSRIGDLVERLANAKIDLVAASARAAEAQLAAPPSMPRTPSLLTRESLSAIYERFLGDGSREDYDDDVWSSYTVDLGDAIVAVFPGMFEVTG